MKLKKVLSVALVAVMTMSMAACGGSNNAADNGGATNGAASDNSAEATNDAAATESSDAACRGGERDRRQSHEGRISASQLAGTD